jgi:hypothetical protein
MSLSISSHLFELMYDLPICCVWIGGIVFAVKYRPRAPKVGLVVTTTLSILLASFAAGRLSHIGYNAIGVDPLSRWREPVLISFAFIHYVDRFVQAVAWAAVLWVLFGLVRQLSDKTQHTIDTIVGSSWAAGDVETLTFEADGVLKAEGQGRVITGEWTIKAKTITVRINNEEHQLEIKGDEIAFKGMPLTRIQ